MMAITLHDYVVAFNMAANPTHPDRWTGEDYEAASVPIMGGCLECGATIAGYNAHPTKCGYLVGSCCIDQRDDGFATVESFGEWMEANADGEVARGDYEDTRYVEDGSDYYPDYSDTAQTEAEYDLP